MCIYNISSVFSLNEQAQFPFMEWKPYKCPAANPAAPMGMFLLWNVLGPLTPVLILLCPAGVLLVSTGVLLVSTGGASPELLGDTLGHRCLCHWELVLLQPFGVPENPAWGGLLCAATPKLHGNGTHWENCRCLLLQLCALDHGLEGCWVQKSSTSRAQGILRTSVVWVPSSIGQSQGF